jgi:hypothetical protein
LTMQDFNHMLWICPCVAARPSVLRNDGIKRPTASTKRD